MSLKLLCSYQAHDYSDVGISGADTIGYENTNESEPGRSTLISSESKVKIEI